ncbi:MAG: tRNA (adenosine(37)-N6)-threonylcarbamoyltransferase complex transferase subunit TsaD [bacterium]
MKILSIETSCDDTGISILEAKGGMTNASFKVLANNSNSQINLHIPFGGVVPMLAKREHIKNLPVLLNKVLKKSKLEKPDLIAVTSGPGLEPALWTGIVFAKELAQKWKVPLIPVNHMEGHVLSVFGKNKGTFKIQKLKTPILTLLVSGGHTQLVLTKEKMFARGGSALGGDYEIIGETLDDAVGEAFDKVARMLDLPYPGGPQISRLAEVERKNKKTHKFILPRPMLHSKNFDFSFSGLKTAVLYLIRDLGGIKKISRTTKAQIALEFENAAIECLVHKTQKAIEKYKIKTLIVAGGVTANQHLKNEVKKITKNKTKLLFPTKGLHGDNSLMIGIAGYLNYIKNKKKVPKIKSLKATGNLRL